MAVVCFGFSSFLFLYYNFFFVHCLLFFPNHMHNSVLSSHSIGIMTKSRATGCGKYLVVSALSLSKFMLVCLLYFNEFFYIDQFNVDKLYQLRSNHYVFSKKVFFFASWCWTGQYPSIFFSMFYEDKLSQLK